MRHAVRPRAYGPLLRACTAASMVCAAKQRCIGSMAAPVTHGFQIQWLFRAGGGGVAVGAAVTNKRWAHSPTLNPALHPLAASCLAATLPHIVVAPTPEGT